MGQTSEESVTEFTSNGNRHYTILIIRILENFVPVLKTSQELYCVSDHRQLHRMSNSLSILTTMKASKLGVACPLRGEFAVR